MSLFTGEIFNIWQLKCKVSNEISPFVCDIFKRGGSGPYSDLRRSSRFSAPLVGAVFHGGGGIFCLRPVTGCLGLAMVFMWGSALREKFNLFFKSFLLALAEFSIWRGDWALGYYSMGFRHFPDISLNRSATREATRTYYVYK